MVSPVSFLVVSDWEIQRVTSFWNGAPLSKRCCQTAQQHLKWVIDPGWKPKRLSKPSASSRSELSAQALCKVQYSKIWCCYYLWNIVRQCTVSFISASTSLGMTKSTFQSHFCSGTVQTQKAPSYESSDVGVHTYKLRTAHPLRLVFYPSEAYFPFHIHARIPITLTWVWIKALLVIFRLVPQMATPSNGFRRWIQIW